MSLHTLLAQRTEASGPIKVGVIGAGKFASMFLTQALNLRGITWWAWPISLRTVHVRLARERPAGTRNVWPARIRRRVFQGDFTQYHVDWDGRLLVVRSATVDPFGEDEAIYLAVEPRHCVLLEDEPLRDAR